MDANKFMERLKEFGACNDAREWADGKSWEEVYNTCHRGDWLLWLFKKVNPGSIRELTLAKGHCANLARGFMKDIRSINAVDVSIKFGEGNTTIEELYAAAAAANAAYTDAAYAAAAAAYAANVAAADAAAYAAADAAYAAAVAAYADAVYAVAAAAAAADAAAADARKESLQKSADICRKYLPIAIWNI